MSTLTKRLTKRRFDALKQRLRLPPDDLLRDLVYRRLWGSILISSFGGQITMLALPLTAALLLHASPTQMGLLTAMEIVPFVLFSLPAGVWLDRVRKMPVYVFGECTLSFAVASVPLAYWLDLLSMPWLYAVGFVIGVVNTVAGSASQVVLTQVVTRDRLVEAHAKNALATSGAEVAGPGVAGALIKLVGAPLALIADAALLMVSVAILRGIVIREELRSARDARFWRDMKAGLGFVFGNRLLVVLAVVIGGWQMAYNAALVVQILFATRTLGMSGQAVGLCYMGMGLGTVTASVLGTRISRRIGPGPCLVIGIALCALGWLLLAVAPVGPLGIAAFAIMLMLFSTGAVMVFINFLAIRQAVTPPALLGRMTSAMRWLTLAAAGPGALLGGWLGEHHGLRTALLFAGCGGLLVALVAWRQPAIRGLKVLPTPDDEADLSGAEATVRPGAVVEASQPI